MVDPPKQRGRPKAKSQSTKDEKAQGLSKIKSRQPPAALALWGEEQIEMDAARSPRKAALAASAAMKARPGTAIKSSTHGATVAPSRGTSSSKSSSVGKELANKKDKRKNGGKEVRKGVSGEGSGSHRSTARSEDSVQIHKSKSSKESKVKKGGGRQGTVEDPKLANRVNSNAKNEGKDTRGKKRGRPRLESEVSAPVDEQNTSNVKKPRGPSSAATPSTVEVSSRSNLKKSRDDDDSAVDDAAATDDDDDDSTMPHAAQHGCPKKHGKSTISDSEEGMTKKAGRGHSSSSKTGLGERGETKSGRARSSSRRQSRRQESEARESEDEQVQEENANRERSAKLKDKGKYGDVDAGGKGKRSSREARSECSDASLEDSEQDYQEEEETDDDETITGKGKQSKKTQKECTRLAASTRRRESSRTQASRREPDGTTNGSSASSTVSAYPKRIRNAPGFFMAGPSSKPPATPPPPSSSARGSSKGKAPAGSAKKGASKIPAAKKITKRSPPPPPLPPPPPPPPYRFEYPGWPAVGGRELLSVGMFLVVATPVMRYGRGFEVKMSQLEEAMACKRPQDNSFLAMLHARLLSNRKELKAMRPGEDRFPYSWWTNRLKNRLAQWYLRRAVLRELIDDAERPDDDEEEVIAKGGKREGTKVEAAEDPKVRANGSSSTQEQDSDKHLAKLEEQPGGDGDGDTAKTVIKSSDSEGDGSQGDARIQDIPREPAHQLPNVLENDPESGVTANDSSLRASEEVSGSGGGSDDQMIEETKQDEAEVESGRYSSSNGPDSSGESMTPTEVEGEDSTVEKALVQTRCEQADVGDAIERRGEEGSSMVLEEASEDAAASVSMTVAEEKGSEGTSVAGRKGKRSSTAAAKRDTPKPKKASTTLCQHCHRRGTTDDTVRCHYEKCSKKFHIHCLPTPLLEVPQGQWYCEDCRAEKRVFGCNACMQNVREEEILQCDGPKCGLEYHFGCLDPPLPEVPDVDWWYCPECVLKDNRVGCRVCKVDVDYHKLLKCDGEDCDSEWHTYCLDPPLKTVPRGSFICPTCTAAQQHQLAMKREREAIAANERRRRRMAQKLAELEEDDEDINDRRKRKNGRRLGPRERLMQEFGTMELYELRIQLLAVDTLLQNLENTEDSDDAVAAGNSDTSTANGSIKEQSPVSGSSAAAKQGDGAESPSAGEKSNASEAPPPGDAAGAAGTAADGAAGDGEGASEATGVESEKGEANAEAGAGGANAAAAPRGSDSSAEAPGRDAGGVGGIENGVAEESGVTAMGASVAKDSADGNGGGGVGGKSGDLMVVDGENLGGVDAGDGVMLIMAREEEIEDDNDNPLVKGTYESLSVSQRVAILHALCEFSLDTEHIRLRAIDEADPDTLRLSPFGCDSAGRIYYQFKHFWKEMRIYRTVHKDSPAPEVDEAAMQIVGYRPTQPASFASSKRRSQRQRGGEEVELVADSLESMQSLADALAKSKSKSKKDDVKLCETIAEEVASMKAYAVEQREKEEKRKASELAREKRALLAQAPKRRSGRLIERHDRIMTEAKAEEQEPEPEPEPEPRTRPTRSHRRRGLARVVNANAEETAEPGASIATVANDDAPGAFDVEETTASTTFSNVPSWEVSVPGGTNEFESVDGISGGVVPDESMHLVRGGMRVSETAPPYLLGRQPLANSPLGKRPRGNGERNYLHESYSMGGNGVRASAMAADVEDREGIGGDHRSLAGKIPGVGLMGGPLEEAATRGMASEWLAAVAGTGGRRLSENASTIGNPAVRGEPLPPAGKRLRHASDELVVGTRAYVDFDRGMGRDITTMSTAADAGYMNRPGPAQLPVMEQPSFANRHSMGGRQTALGVPPELVPGTVARNYMRQDRNIASTVAGVGVWGDMPGPKLDGHADAHNSSMWNGVLASSHSYRHGAASDSVAPQRSANGHMAFDRGGMGNLQGASGGGTVVASASGRMQAPAPYFQGGAMNGSALDVMAPSVYSRQEMPAPSTIGSSSRMVAEGPGGGGRYENSMATGAHSYFSPSRNPINTLDMMEGPVESRLQGPLSIPMHDVTSVRYEAQAGAGSSSTFGGGYIPGGRGDIYGQSKDPRF